MSIHPYPRAFRFLPLAAAILLIPAGRLSSQPAITLNGGNITMAITSGQAGLEPVAVTNTTISLDYRRQTAISKITVATTCPGQKFSLAVVATSASLGNIMPQVNLVNGMAAADLIRDIPQRPPPSLQTANLQYTASATFAQGNSAELGDDVHTVVYTIVAQ
ncbi:MAG: hypothetical protein WD295_06430 [Bacteroidota bacterium]